MRKARVALCVSLAAAGSAFAGLALSAQSAGASTVPVTAELKSAVITAGQYAQVLAPVVVAERRIIADGVQLVPQSVRLALPVERLDGQLLKLESAVTHEAAVVGAVRNVSSPVGQKVIGTAAADTRRFIVDIARNEAAAKPASSSLVRSLDLGPTRFGAQVGEILTDLGRVVSTTIGRMESLLH